MRCRYIDVDVKNNGFDPKIGSRFVLQTKFGSFTYHDDKWIIRKDGWKDLSIEELVTKLQADPYVKACYGRIMSDVKVFCERRGKPTYGAAFELCAKSFLEEPHVIKLHLHVCWIWSERQHIREPACFMIGGSCRCTLNSHLGIVRGPRSRNSAPMLYYLEMPKVGKVFSSTNRHAFIDYAVNARWISGWLQCKKISAADAAQVSVFYRMLFFVAFKR